MSTLFKRLYAYRKKTGKPIPSIEQRQELGEIVKAEFFGNFKLPAWKVEQTEFNQTFKVLNYHPKFTGRMNELIKAYYEAKGDEIKMPVKKEAVEV